MGMILKFVARRNADAQSGHTVPSTGEPCRIILFTGVRYERWTDSEKPAPQKKRAKRRKRVQRKQA